ncbi:MAG: hypothetical protein AAGN35_26080 [Bacteroidota bacterium]
MSLRIDRIALCLPMLALLLAFSTLPAQDDDKRGKVSGGYGYFSAGIIDLETAPLNASLTGNGYGEASSTQITLGGAGFLIVRNFIIGGEGHGVVSQEMNSSAQNATLEGGWGQFNLGYVLLSGKGILLYPKVGIGGYNHRLVIQNAQNLPSVNDVFAEGNYSGTELIRNGLLVSGALGFQFMPGFDDSSGSGLSIGLEVGYNYAANEGAWEAYGTPLTGGPSLNMTGIFARLNIGFSGWHRQ